MGGSVLAERVGDAPAGAYAQSLQVRSYEVLRNGCVSPAMILRYLEHVATEASAHVGFDHEWYETHNSAWVVREMNLLLARLPGLNDELVLATWLSDYRRVQAYREYAIWHARTGQRVARARARWAYIDRHRGVPMRAHDEMISRFHLLGTAMRPRRASAQSVPAAPSARRVTEMIAREYEADTQQHVNNCAYVDWLYDELVAALGSAPELSGGRLARPRRYTIEYSRPTVPGDVVRVETHVTRAGTRMLTASQEITNLATSATTVRAYSEFLLSPRY